MDHAGDPQVLRSAVNDPVLDYLRELSAHGDIASALWDAVATLGDVQSYSPDMSGYRFVAVATRNVVFGFATGMSDIGFRLSPEFKIRALATGAGDLPQPGSDWVSFTVFRDDWPDPDLRFWARKAYVFAREEQS